MSATTLVNATAVHPADLTLADRCDSCEAQAFVRAVWGSTLIDLLFCNHHANRFGPGLIAQGAQIWRDPVIQRENDTDH